MSRRNYTSIEELFTHYTNTSKSPGRAIWQTTREMARCFKEGKAPVKWNTLFYRVLGYSAVLDLKGHGVIHPSEPTQAVFFNRQSLKKSD